MIVLSIALSEACNLSCTYCNVDKLSKLSIDPLKFLETFKEVRKDNPNELIQIDFYGGEPLLQFNKVKYILESLKDDNIQYFMPTNGLLLNQEKLDILNKYNVDISLSYDGLWQDITRPQRGRNTGSIYKEKKDFFNKINNFKIHTMIYPGQYNLLENHLHLLDYGANAQMTIIKDIGVWTLEDVQKLKFGIKELADWYIEDTSRDLPETLRYYLKSIVLHKAKRYEVQSCGAGKTHLSFSENKLISCNRFKDEPELEAQIPNFLEMPECQKCEVKQYCKKGCMYENIKNGKPIVEVCEIFKYSYSIIEYMLKTLKNDKNFKEIIKKEIYDEFGNG